MTRSSRPYRETGRDQGPGPVMIRPRQVRFGATVCVSVRRVMPGTCRVTGRRGCRAPGSTRSARWVIAAAGAPGRDDLPHGSLTSHARALSPHAVLRCRPRGRRRGPAPHRRRRAPPRRRRRPHAHGRRRGRGSRARRADRGPRAHRGRSPRRRPRGPGPGRRPHAEPRAARRARRRPRRHLDRPDAERGRGAGRGARARDVRAGRRRERALLPRRRRHCPIPAAARPAAHRRTRRSSPTWSRSSR